MLAEFSKLQQRINVAVSSPKSVAPQPMENYSRLDLGDFKARE